MKRERAFVGVCCLEEEVDISVLLPQNLGKDKSGSAHVYLQHVCARAGF